MYVYDANLYTAVAYVFLCKLSYGYHNQVHFIDIFQMERFLAVKYGMGYEKIWGFLWYQNLQKFE